MLRSRLLLAPALLLAACEAPDPLRVLKVTGVETYWAVDSSVRSNNYIAPVVRLHVTNQSDRTLELVEAKAAFFRQGEKDQWGGAWQRLPHALKRAQTVLVVLKSDGHYYSEGTPESMFRHEQFRDARAELALRVGSSDFIHFDSYQIERRIGSREAQLDSAPTSDAEPVAPASR